MRASRYRLLRDEAGAIVRTTTKQKYHEVLFVAFIILATNDSSKKIVEDFSSTIK